MSGPGWIAYNFAYLRVVPHVHLGAFQNLGVVVHARTENFIGARTITDPGELARRAPGVDLEMLVGYLDGFRRLLEGDPGAGAVALLPPSERFHWMTAPRSDVLQASPIHEGLCLDPEAELEALFRECVA